MLKLFARKTKNDFYTKREYRVSNFIPYESHFDSTCIITKNKDLISVFKVGGFIFETADDEDLDAKKGNRNNFLRSIDSSKFGFWFHTVRSKKIVDLEGDFKDEFTQTLNNAWRDRYKRNRSYINEHYVSVVITSPKKGFANKLQNLISRAQRNLSKEAEKAELFERRRELAEMTNRFMSSFASYNPKVLGIRETENGLYSEIIEFFSLLINFGSKQKYLVPQKSISSYLAFNRLYFSSFAKLIECRTFDGGRRFAGILNIKKYGNVTYPGIFDVFLQMPFEYIISQVYVAAERNAVISKMSTQQKRLASIGDKAITQTMELTAAMDMTQGGEINFGDHFFSLVIFDEDIKRLEDNLNACYGEMINMGLTPTRESMSMQGSFWALLPDNFEYISRRTLINTLNVASFVSFHNYPVGKANGNHWGPAVTLLETTSGTPYFFNFHVRDIGHTVIIGPTGTGKTLLMNFLVAQGQKFKGRTYFFDKDRGAEIFLKSINAFHTLIQPRDPCGFNPLQLADTKRNRAFLVDWIVSMAMAINPDKSLSSQDFERIDEAIEGNYKLDVSERRLRNIIPFLGFEVPDSLPNRLKLWHSDGPYAGLFDNEKDELDLTKHSVYGFDMTDVLYDKVSLGPALLYLFHRINISLDGTPTMIVLDEAWSMIDNDIFAPKLKNWLKVLRKLNAMVIFATQTVEDLGNSKINDTLVQQTSTQIFLANSRATEMYRKNFMLTQREFLLIKTMDPASRYFLLKQDEEKVVARVDLTGMDDIIAVLSARADTALIMDKVIEEVGKDPHIWVPIFQKRVAEQSKITRKQREIEAMVYS
ncbi:MAG: VirB4 family type IV secretion/conjugal transfer ATPase [Alphaproteobacteria bacterium]